VLLFSTPLTARLALAVLLPMVFCEYRLTAQAEGQATDLVINEIDYD
jgi:hypothetical protein